MSRHRLRVHHGEGKGKTAKALPKKRRMTKIEREFAKRWHALTDEIFEAAASIWGKETDNVWRTLASAADLSYETVRRLGDRETRFPHLFTIDKMAHAIGGEIVVKVNNLRIKQLAAERKRKSRKVA
jgi:hypothetical protein